MSFDKRFASYFLQNIADISIALLLNFQIASPDTLEGKLAVEILQCDFL